MNKCQIRRAALDAGLELQDIDQPSVFYALECVAAEAESLINKDSKEGVWKWMVTFFKTLEELMPPKPGSHYPLSYAKYGDPDSGYEDKLALTIPDSDEKLFLEKEVFCKDPVEVARELVKISKDSKQ